MAVIHFILQGKGGVGKSMIASLLYQACHRDNKQVIAFDTDPVNRTFARYKEFTVTEIEIMKGGDIDPRKFDTLFEALIASPVDSHVIVDNGASSFVALGAYLEQNDVLPALEEEGHKVFFHTVITGGQAVVDTSTGLAELAENFSSTPIVVWLNPFFGAIELSGKTFEEFKVYEQHSDKFHALIRIPDMPKTTFGKDLEELFAKKQSFEAGIASSGIAVRRRLKIFWDAMFIEIQKADFLGEQA